MKELATDLKEKILMKKIILIIHSLFLLVVLSTAQAAEITEQNSYEARYAYAMGYRIGQSLKSHGVVKLNTDDLLRGITDYLDDKKPELTEVEINDTINSYHQSLKIQRKTGGIANLVNQARYAYAIGYRMGQSLKSKNVKKPKPGDLLSGINDCLDDKKARLITDGEINDAITSYHEYLNALQKKDGKANLQEAVTFLEQNQSRQGVMKMPSGLQYEIVKPANGKQPKLNDSVLVHYQGSFISGEVFDSSINRGEPVEFKLADVIPGFKVALTQMHIGEKWKIYVPPSLGYGERGVKDSIGANEMLIFDLELLAINP
jgi:FKBP-type peptidyl-prolyl cis-trans isomerase FklB